MTYVEMEDDGGSVGGGGLLSREHRAWDSIAIGDQLFEPSALKTFTGWQKRL
jgi:hypothetical protein